METQATRNEEFIFLFQQAVLKTQVAIVFSFWIILKTFTFIYSFEYLVILISLSEEGSWSCLGPREEIQP